MTTEPGMHPEVKEMYNRILSKKEQQIIERLSQEWLVTYIDSITLSNSKYPFILLKPTNFYKEKFNLEREIICVFSSYTTLEPRTLDAIGGVQNHLITKRGQSLRVDKICSIVFSAAYDVEQKIKDFLKSKEESQIVIPIFYNEYINPESNQFLINKFRKHFYNRDLFSFQGPLKQDLYFFGRQEEIQNIISRHRSNENSGLFGLRKSGKTSVIYGVERTLALSEDTLSVIIDCQNTALNQRRWYEALWYISDSLANKYQLPSPPTEDVFSPKDASANFESFVKKVNKTHFRRIFFIFDEIENITPQLSSVAHWKDDSDFIHFWQTLRSTYQSNSECFSYLIVGTNPTSIEKRQFSGKDNPLFMSVSLDYISPFNYETTREMVRKLGKIMGLKFKEEIYSYLNIDYGGHPFLMRHVCSAIHKNVEPDERPSDVGKQRYQRGSEEFNQNYGSYIDMILDVLNDNYKDEYEMLKYLAIDDLDTFNFYAKESREFTDHLVGYGLIEREGESFNFKLEVIKNYILKKENITPLNKTRKQVIEELVNRRDEIERDLRGIIKLSLKMKLGDKAKEAVTKILRQEQKRKASSLDYIDLFNPSKSQIYLDDLRKIILKNWDQVFEDIFEENGKNNDVAKSTFDTHMKEINNGRKLDSHAADYTDDQLDELRFAFTYIKKRIDRFK